MTIREFLAVKANDTKAEHHDLRLKTWRVVHEPDDQVRFRVWMITFPQSGGSEGMKIILEDEDGETSDFKTGDTITPGRLDFWYKAMRVEGDW